MMYAALFILNGSGRRHPEIDLYDEIPDPHPHSMEHQRDNAWVKMIMVAYLRYNRFILYDGTSCTSCMSGASCWHLLGVRQACTCVVCVS